MNLEIQTLTISAGVHFNFLRYRETVDQSMRAIDLARQVNDPHVEVSARSLALKVPNCLGESKLAEEQAAAALGLAEQLGARSWLSVALRSSLTRYRLLGDWQGASEFADRGLALDPHYSLTLAHATLLYYEVGDFAKGEAYLEQLLAVMRAFVPGPGTVYGLPT